MAWQEPKLNWSSGDRLTCEEMNRINGNLNYLAGNTALSTSFTQNSFLTVNAWKGMTKQVAQLAAAANLEAVLIDTQLTAENVQAVEEIISAAKVYFDLVEENSKYPLYTNQVYVGAHYARG